MASNMRFLNIQNVPASRYNSPKLQCSPVTLRDGTKAYAKINLLSELAKRPTNEVLTFIPLFTRDTFRTAPDGVYTWILSDKGFFANKVHSILELGTLHLNLAEHTAASYIYGAGECGKMGGTLEYNTLSGSFMVPLIRKYSNNVDLDERVHSTIEHMFGAMGFETIIRVEKTLIDKERMPLTEDELAMYVRAGYTVYLYDRETTCNNKDKLRIEAELRAKTAALKFFKKDTEQYRKAENYIQTLQTELETVKGYVPKLYKGGTRKRRRALNYRK